MSEASDHRSDEFLKISSQFQLGALTTEASHPVTASLSETAQQDISQALDLLFQVDADVVAKYREFIASGRANEIALTILQALRAGGRMFFAGCGATGRLSIQLAAIWRDYWQRRKSAGHTLASSPAAASLEDRAFSVMAGGDYALIKSVEGFEDHAAFGKKQLHDWGPGERDVVFAITEGGETPFVIGAAWEAAESGAKVYFVYNNPDDVLCRHIERSRAVIENSRIEKINLATGPMAITGSTRMQATTIQLCVLLTVLEMALRDWERDVHSGAAPSPDIPLRDAAAVPHEFLEALVRMQATLRSPAILAQLAQLVALEESVYRAGKKNTYFADRLGIDVLTDTTERSPTYCTPPFRKFDHAAAAESWSFLFLPETETARAWTSLLKRPPQCIDWREHEIRALVAPDQLDRSLATVRAISQSELMRFRIGLDGAPYRPLNSGDSAIGIISWQEEKSGLASNGFPRVQLEAAQRAGARIGLVRFHRGQTQALPTEDSLKWAANVAVPLPEDAFLLDGITRVGAKMLLNAVSTCAMVRLGRVRGNYMVWVVASNRKLIDRATRYIQKLTDLSYPSANRLLFEVIEYVEPRMKEERAYPPMVELAVLRALHKLSNEEAEQRLASLPANRTS